MKFNDVKRILGIFALATTTSLTACGTEPTQPIETTVEAEPTQTVEEPTPTPIVEEEVTVSYDQCATEADTLTMVNGEQVDYTVKGYVAPNYFEYMQGLDHNYEVDAEEGYVTDDSIVVSDNYEITEDGKLLVRDYHMQSGAIPVVKYVRISETEVEARYIGAAPADSNVISGITFVLEKNDEGVYKMTDLLGVFGESIKGLPVYEGTFDGWAMEAKGDVIYDVGDEVMISGDLDLYPHFKDNEASKVAAEDGTFADGGSQIEEIEIDGVKHTVLRVIHINGTKKDKDGNIVATKKYALAGLDSKKDTVKGVDKDTVEKQQTEEKDPVAKTDTSKTDNTTKKPANGSDTKPGNTAPEKDPASAQAQDTFDRSTETPESTKSAQEIAAEDGVEYVDISDWDNLCDASLNFGWE